jgi:hypothetical protein
MADYRCPVCRKTLTKRQFESALGILDKREKHLQHEKDALFQRLRKAQAEAKAREKQAHASGVLTERRRAQRLMQGKDRVIGKLQERIEQLKKGTTPQTDGLEFEDKLCVRLSREFPDDDVQHKGKGGDILQIVRFQGKPAGTIIYECKRCPRINRSHVEQTHAAKQLREADFAVLITTGEKKGFSGLAKTSGVMIVAPLGTIPLAALLRLHLIEMLRAKIAKGERAKIANKMVRYITSPQFKNPIEEVIRVTTELKDMIQEEAKDHYRVWKRRWDHYQTISWDSSQIQSNVRLVLHGKEPSTILRKEGIALQLPALTKDK